MVAGVANHGRSAAPIPYINKTDGMTPGTPVKLEAASGKIVAAGDGEIVLLGMALSYADADEEVLVEAGYPGVEFELPYLGTFTQDMVGKFFGLDLTGGVYSVNLADTTNDIFKLKSADTANKLARVEIVYTRSQALVEVA